MQEFLSDPSVQNVLLSVAGNALTSLLYGAARLSVAPLKPNGDTEPTTQQILNAASESVSDSLDWAGPPRLEEVCLFITSPEVSSFLKQIFATKMVANAETSLADLKTEFIHLTSRFLCISLEQITPVANTLHDALLSAAEDTFDEAVQKGSLAAHEAKSTFRHNILYDEIATVRKNIDFLLSTSRLNVKDILVFESTLRRQVELRHADIIPPNFDHAIRLPIDHLYVPPNLTRANAKVDRSERALSFKDAVRTIHKTVLLGNPGGGKSTFAQKVVHDLATGTCHGTNRTPLLIILRDYAAARKEKAISLLQYIEQVSTIIYQLPPPHGAVEYLLLNGRAFVIFDGLDELLDTSHRQEIARDIESFCHLYPSVPALITSREVGYEQAPLNPAQFESYVLEPFSDEQVRKYVENWFGTDYDLLSEQRKAKASAFYNESRLVSDLCANPLMLALMCNIYRGDNYIPTNRPDVYEKCALMLFERWDRGRGIRVTLPIENHVRPAMMHLAYWIYADEALQSGVTEHQLIDTATAYLCPRRFEDREEAQFVARQFIEFCRGRAWVFTDTGTTRTGERIYQFTHRTFLEYFTAAQLVRIYPTPQKLFKVLLPRIKRREWDVIAQLAIQIQNKNVADAADTLLSLTLARASKGNDDKALNCLSFLAGCLEFVVPSPQTLRAITKTIVEFAIRKFASENVFASRRFIGTQTIPTALSETIAGLLNASIENRAVIADTLKHELVSMVCAENEVIAIRAAEVAFNLTITGHISRRHTPNRSVAAFWNKFSDDFWVWCEPQLAMYERRIPQISLAALWKGRISLQDFYRTYKLEGLFKPIQHSIFPVFTSPPSHWILTQALERDASRFEAISETLAEIGRDMIAEPTPWYVKRRTDPSPFLSINRVSESSKHPVLCQDQLFAVFGLLAVPIEADDTPRRTVAKDLLNNENSIINELRPALRQRFESPDTLDLVSLDAFSPTQQAIIRRWMRKNISFFETEK